MVTAAPRTDPRRGSYCTYTETAPAGASPEPPLLTVEVMLRSDAADARSAVDKSGGTVVSGVGDDAHASSPGGLSVAVFLSRGADFVVLLSLNKGVTSEGLVRLAGVLAPRI